MKMKANSIVKMVVGTTAAVAAVVVANSFAAPNVVVAEENSTTYQQTDQFTTDDGSKVTVFESQPVATDVNEEQTSGLDDADGGLGTAELVIVDEAE